MVIDRITGYRIDKLQKSMLKTLLIKEIEPQPILLFCGADGQPLLTPEKVTGKKPLSSRSGTSRFWRYICLWR